MDFVVGALILLFVGLIPVVGGLVTGVATVVGLGTILLAAQALRERQQAV